MTDKDGFTRINVIFPQDDKTTLDLIDQARGNLSRSAAIHRTLEYIANTGGIETIRGIIRTRHAQTEKTP